MPQMFPIWWMSDMIIFVFIVFFVFSKISYFLGFGFFDEFFLREGSDSFLLW